MHPIVKSDEKIRCGNKISETNILMEEKNIAFAYPISIRNEYKKKQVHI